MLENQAWGPCGYAIIEADWCVGEIVKKLEEQGLLENTLIVFSSDNGPVLNDGYYDDAVEKLGNHTPAGGLRGGKYSLFEAGTKVPFITYWKGKITPSVSDAVVCQMDLMASFAKLTGAKAPTTDSQNLLSTLLGETKKGRKELVLEANGRLAYRQKDCIFIPPYKGGALMKEVNIETGVDPEGLLYNVAKDPSQRNNIAKTEPKMMAKMKKAMVKIVGDKYSSMTQDMKLK